MASLEIPRPLADAKPMDSIYEEDKDDEFSSPGQRRAVSREQQNELIEGTPNVQQLQNATAYLQKEGPSREDEQAADEAPAVHTGATQPGLISASGHAISSKSIGAIGISARSPHK